MNINNILLLCFCYFMSCNKNNNDAKNENNDVNSDNSEIERFLGTSSSGGTDIAILAQDTWILEFDDNAKKRIIQSIEEVKANSVEEMQNIELIYKKSEELGGKVCKIPIDAKVYIKKKEILEPFSTFFYAELDKTNIVYPKGYKEENKCKISKGYLYIPHFLETDLSKEEIKYRKNKNPEDAYKWTTNDEAQRFIYVSFFNRDDYEQKAVNDKKTFNDFPFFRISLISTKKNADGKFIEFEWLPGISGHKNKQNYRTGLLSKTSEATPEALWYFDPLSGLNGLSWGKNPVKNNDGTYTYYWDTNASDNKGLGPFFGMMYMGSSTIRSFIGFHSDGNTRGTDGCVGIIGDQKIFKNLKMAASWFENKALAPKGIITDWNLGLIKNEIKLTRNDIAYKDDLCFILSENNEALVIDEITNKTTKKAVITLNNGDKVSVKDTKGEFYSVSFSKANKDYGIDKKDVYIDKSLVKCP